MSKKCTCTHIHIHTHADRRTRALQCALRCYRARCSHHCRGSILCVSIRPRSAFTLRKYYFIGPKFESFYLNNWIINLLKSNKYVKVYVVLHWVWVITSIHPRCVIIVWHKHVKHNCSFNLNLNKIMNLFNYIYNYIKNNVLNTESLPDTLKGNCRRKTMVTPDVLILLNGHSARIKK